jgi:predicted Zn-dependent peptidase
MTKQIQLSENEVFVPVEAEGGYCRQHKINFQRLSNGVILVGIARDMAESVETSLNYRFGTGAWHDPKGKEGLHHLLEHLFNKNLFMMAADYDCRVNASTSPEDMIEYVYGPISNQMMDFGIWPVLGLAHQMLMEPLKQFGDLNKILAIEKEVIAREILANESKHGWWVKDFLLRWLFGEDNPMTIYPPGKTESVRKLTGNDLELAVNQGMVANKLIISVVTDSGYDVLNKLTNRLVDTFSQYPRRETVLEGFPWPAVEKQAKHKNQEIVKFNTGLKNGMVSIVFAWRYEHEVLSRESFALKGLGEFVEDRLFWLSRQNGWSYRSSAYPVGASDKSGFIIVQLDVPRADFSSKRMMVMLQEIQKGLLVGDEELKKISLRMQKRVQIRPVSSTARLNWLLFGLERYSRLVDIDLIINQYRDMRQEDLQKWLTLLTQTEPLMAAIGDVG